VTPVDGWTWGRLILGGRWWRLRILTVGELTSYIKDRLESDPLLARVWVRGEVSSCVYHPSGHLYFEIKDENARLRVVMFRSQVERLRVRLDHGTAVVVRGSLGVYGRAGTYQLYAQAVEAEGAGALHEALERLKERLQREGLFDTARKRALPPFPAVVGLVTSPAGAAVKDMLTVLRKRWPVARVVLAPVSVQGETAPYEIAQAIRHLNETGAVDVIIVGRGGGAPEELWAFNTELVARTIFDSRVPVVSAVGHEKDVTISDLVADRRAPTPSAAAEMVVPDQRAIRAQLTALQAGLGRAVKRHLDWRRLRLEALEQRPVLAEPAAWISRPRREKVVRLQGRLHNAVAHRLAEHKAQLAFLAGRLQALSPLGILARGFSVCRRSDGKILRNAGEVNLGEKVTVRLYVGGLLCTVEERYLDGEGTPEARKRGQASFVDNPS
jgi:exodeoxyribonuclease VII large subunit